MERSDVLRPTKKGEPNRPTMCWRMHAGSTHAWLLQAL